MRKIRKLIIFILCILITAVIVLRVAGFKSYSIKTESMTPALAINDMIYVYPVSFESLNKGDVITYVIDDKGTTITHRIISIDEGNKTVQTQGDNNEYPDIEPVGEENIIGKMVFKIPLLGKLEFLNNLKGDD